jgi:hypothetical protein
LKKAYGLPANPPTANPTLSASIGERAG